METIHNAILMSIDSTADGWHSQVVRRMCIRGVLAEEIRGFFWRA